MCWNVGGFRTGKPIDNNMTSPAKQYFKVRVVVDVINVALFIGKMGKIYSKLN